MIKKIMTSIVRKLKLIFNIYEWKKKYLKSSRRPFSKKKEKKYIWCSSDSLQMHMKNPLEALNGS